MAIEVVAGDSPTRLKSLRLSALKDAPYAFGAKYEDELLIPDTQWQERLQNTYWCFVMADRYNQLHKIQQEISKSENGKLIGKDIELLVSGHEGRHDI